MTVAEFDAEIERRFPWIEWRMPVIVDIMNGLRGFACRLCMAREGFRAWEVNGKLFDSLTEFDTHLREEHGQQHGD